MISNIAVVGGGVAGIAAVQTLRSEGYDGRLYLIGEEKEHPYDRTALSKSVLGGEKSSPPLLLPTDCYSDLRVELLLGSQAELLLLLMPCIGHHRHTDQSDDDPSQRHQAALGRK